MRVSMWMAAAILVAPCLAEAAGSCPTPKFTVSDLKTGDGKLDRGWIGGVSLVDVDGDGDLDLYATRGYDTGPNPPKPPRPDRSALYLNDGKGGFTRSDDTILTNYAHYTSGSTWADMDGDGDLDAFVSTQVGKPDVFYRNLGGGRFAMEDMGEATTVKASNFTSAWADIDGDGDVDLLSGGPTLEPGAPMLVYRNDGGRLVRVTDLPIENGVNNPGAVIWSDLDNDGDVDLVVTNSDVARLSKIEAAKIEHPVVYLNDGGWRFRAVEDPALADPKLSSANAAVGDFDGDGAMDLFIGAYTLKDAAEQTKDRRDALFRGLGDGRFERVPGFQSAYHVDWSTGAAFADFDRDGDLDLMSVTYGDGIALHVNDGKSRLTPVSVPSLDARKKTHSGLATGDIDGDGDIDAVSGDWGEIEFGDYISIIRNDSEPCGDWLEVELRSRAGAPNPPGARVVLVTRARNREYRQLREAAAQTSFRSQGASFFVFGVPKGETVAGAEIRWPDGRVQRITAPPLNQRTVVRDGA